MAALGIAIREVPTGWREERRRAMSTQLADVAAELGRWPTGKEWERSGRQPSRRTYVRLFGSWEAACRHAERLARRGSRSGRAMPVTSRRTSLR